MVLKCKAGEVPLKDQGQFPNTHLNAFFLDIQYQAMIVWVQKYHNGANSLPLQAEKGTLFADILFNENYFVHLKIKENTPIKMIADCTVYDNQGKVLLLTEGAGLTVSPNLKW